MREHSKTDEARDGLIPITEVASMRCQRKTRLVLPRWAEVSGVLDLAVNRDRCVVRVPNRSAYSSLPPFAPRPLRRFTTTIEALTPVRVSSPYRSPFLACAAFRKA